MYVLCASLLSKRQRSFTSFADTQSVSLTVESWSAILQVYFLLVRARMQPAFYTSLLLLYRDGYCDIFGHPVLHDTVSIQLAIVITGRLCSSLSLSLFIAVSWAHGQMWHSVSLEWQLWRHARKSCRPRACHCCIETLSAQLPFPGATFESRRVEPPLSQYAPHVSRQAMAPGTLIQPMHEWRNFPLPSALCRSLCFDGLFLIMSWHGKARRMET